MTWLRSRSVGRPCKKLRASKQANASCKEPSIQKQTKSSASCQQAQTPPECPAMASDLASSQQPDLAPSPERLLGASGTMEHPAACNPCLDELADKQTQMLQRLTADPVIVSDGRWQNPLPGTMEPALACKDSLTKIRADKMEAALKRFKWGRGPWVHLIGGRRNTSSYCLLPGIQTSSPNASPSATLPMTWGLKWSAVSFSRSRMIATASEALPSEKYML
ncbi:hypothetical protein WJX74_005992 [Apatococcus lobatus]|uniref:Uncharacterized protein n=1 Tax=Apatococcus lobatus TaxID=904363 RepID=A0AAW1R359_9CHLO